MWYFILGKKKETLFIYLLEVTAQCTGRDSKSCSMILKKGESVLLNHNKTLSPLPSVIIYSHGASSCSTTSEWCDWAWLQTFWETVRGDWSELLTSSQPSTIREFQLYRAEHFVTLSYLNVAFVCESVSQSQAKLFLALWELYTIAPFWHRGPLTLWLCFVRRSGQVAPEWRALQRHSKKYKLLLTVNQLEEERWREKQQRKGKERERGGRKGEITGIRAHKQRIVWNNFLLANMSHAFLTQIALATFTVSLWQQCFTLMSSLHFSVLYVFIQRPAPFTHTHSCRHTYRQFKKLGCVCSVYENQSMDLVEGQQANEQLISGRTRAPPRTHTVTQTHA